MARRNEHLDALLTDLGAAYLRTLHGDGSAAAVARAVTAVEHEQARLLHRLIPRARPPRPEPARAGRWRVRDVMCTEEISVAQNAQAREIAALMTRYRVTAVPVVAARGRVVGVVSDGDLLRAGAAEPRSPGPAGEAGGPAGAPEGDKGLTAAELMSTPAITIGPDATPGAAARRMRQAHARLLPVVTPAGHLLGVLSRRHLLSIFLRPDAEIAAEVQAVLHDYLRLGPPGVTVRAHDGVVTLSGRITADEQRRAALVLAAEVEGVARVVERLAPQHPAAPGGKAAAVRHPAARGSRR